MGKVGRFACIFTPMVLTLAGLICLALAMSGQTSKNNKIQRDLWFFKADTRGFVDNPELDLPDVPGLDTGLLDALQGATAAKNLKDFYLVGLWNYCEGDIDDKEVHTITYCSDRKNYFWFNPIEVWKLSNTSAERLFNDEFNKGLDAYHKVSRWMFASFVIAIILTLAEFVIGITAIFSRWGSLITTFVSTAQTIFVFAAAVTSTTMYGALVSVFASVLKPYNIKASMGKQMLSVVWLAVVFSLASGFFWLISVCCCSGKSDKKKVKVEKTPYTYERVTSYTGASHGEHGHQMHPMAAGPAAPKYEPFRHEGSTKH